MYFKINDLSKYVHLDLKIFYNYFNYAKKYSHKP